ncbi:O-antigen flippase Wzx domain protein [Escherichia coli DEC1A]|nr:O-antigen flippase Wzx domain protein [Escherichia coli DEC1A]
MIAFLESTSNTIKILFSFDGNIKRQEKLSIGIKLKFFVKVVFYQSL